MQGFKRLSMEVPDRKDVIAIVCLIRRVIILNTSADEGANIVQIKQNI